MTEKEPNISPEKVDLRFKTQEECNFFTIMMDDLVKEWYRLHEEANFFLPTVTEEDVSRLKTDKLSDIQKVKMDKHVYEVYWPSIKSTLNEAMEAGLITDESYGSWTWICMNVVISQLNVDMILQGQIKEAEQLRMSVNNERPLFQRLNYSHHMYANQSVIDLLKLKEQSIISFVSYMDEYKNQNEGKPFEFEGLRVFWNKFEQDHGDSMERFSRKYPSVFNRGEVSMENHVILDKDNI